VLKRRGFTTVELLMVIVIMAAASAVAGLRVYRGLDSAALRSSSHRLLRLARYGRLLAGEHRMVCKLHVDLDEGKYWLTARAGGAQAAAKETGNSLREEVVRNVYVRPEVLPERVRFCLAQIAGGQAVRQGEIVVEFKVDGSATAGLIQIGTARETNTLLIYPCTAKARLVGKAVAVLPSDTIELEGMSGTARAELFE